MRKMSRKRGMALHATLAVPSQKDGSSLDRTPLACNAGAALGEYPRGRFPAARLLKQEHATKIARFATRLGTTRRRGLVLPAAVDPLYPVARGTGSRIGPAWIRSGNTTVAGSRSGTAERALVESPRRFPADSRPVGVRRLDGTGPSWTVGMGGPHSRLRSARPIPPQDGPTGHDRGIRHRGMAPARGGAGPVVGSWPFPKPGREGGPVTPASLPRSAGTRARNRAWRR